MKTKLVYLDNDGVLNTYNHHPTHSDTRYAFSTLLDGHLLKEKIEMISTFVKQHNAKIIVSSSWRYYYKSLDELKKDYHDMGFNSDDILDMTDKNSTITNRTLEILHDVQKHNVKEWIAFDDDIDPDQHYRLIKVSPNIGLTHANLTQANKIFLTKG